VIEHRPFAGTEFAQLLLGAAKFPLAVAVKLRGVLRLLIRAIDFVPVVPMPCELKFRLVMDRVA
jgi:hypothetical protein